MLTRTLAALAALTLATPAQAEMMTAIDRLPPDYSCDQATGYSPPRARNCYVPFWRGTFGPAHANPAFSVAFTLDEPATIEATYRQVAYVNSEQYGAGAEYSAAIGVDSMSVPCGLAPGLVFDTAGELSGELTAVCVVTLAAGPHVVYALEAARAGAFAYHGAVNQLLTVRY
jgi:hypothetical protein